MQTMEYSPQGRTTPAATLLQASSRGIPQFAKKIEAAGVHLRRECIETVQINLGKLCNQSCLHCHVEAGPQRKEIMDRATAELALEFVHASGASIVDLTGGAPELNPSFRSMVTRLAAQGYRVLDRTNLTVFFEPGQEDLPELLASARVEIVASLPCYTEENVDAQRGRGVYAKSIAALQRLNQLGYGGDGSDLILNLVYNPLGAFLPGDQLELEADYKRELAGRFGIRFNNLLTIANVPVGRFAHSLARQRGLEVYLASLAGSFNPATLARLMCRRMVSLSWDGYVFDCDFNQMLGQRLGGARPFRLGETSASEIARQLRRAEILIGPHCYACTAGAGSSCTGALVSL